MSDSFTILNIGVGGHVMDEEAVIYGSAPTQRQRARICLAGSNLAEIVRVLNSNPVGSEYGLVVRTIPSGTQAVSITNPGTPVAQFNTAAAVAPSVETTIASYTVGVGQTLNVSGFTASGSAQGIYRLYFDSSVVLVGRSSVAQPTVSMSFNNVPQPAAAAVVVAVKITHFASSPAEFDATITGYLT